MSAHDRHLAGFRHSAVMARCLACGEEFDADLVEEYGQSWTDPEECPKCGASDRIEVDTLSDLDIQERRLEAKGIDF